MEKLFYKEKASGDLFLCESTATVEDLTKIANKISLSKKLEQKQNVLPAGLKLVELVGNHLPEQIDGKSVTAKVNAAVQFDMGEWEILDNGELCFLYKGATKMCMDSRGLLTLSVTTTGGFNYSTTKIEEKT